MKDLETLKITNPEGKEMEIKVITILKKPDNSKSFLLYTFDDKAESVDIYASLIKEENGVNVLDAVTDKEDWDMIQKAIQELSEEQENTMNTEFYNELKANDAEEKNANSLNELAHVTPFSSLINEA